MIGETISHYKIVEKLGEGGMGVVYKAEDTKLKRTVALKFLPPELTRDTEAKERFVHEARAAASLNHPNICTVYEVDEAEGQSFIAMEFIEGLSLKEKIKARPLKLKEAADIAIQIAEGLQNAHARNIVHRDIKPANIMVTQNGQVKIMDFGLAKLTGQTKLTKDGTTLGTVAYMSPEQARGESVDHRTDIWSLGVVLYEMVAGQIPFKGEYEQAVMYSILNDDPEPLTARRTGVPLDLDRIVFKLLAKDPAARYQHIDEVPVDLRGVEHSTMDTSGIRTTTVSRQITRGKPHPRRTIPLTMAALLILLAIVTTGIIMKFWWTEPSSLHSSARFIMDFPDTAPMFEGFDGDFALSPDGERLVYVGNVGANTQLFLREMNRLEVKALSGTEGAASPFFSPDGKWIGFAAGNGDLQKLYLEGGKPISLCESSGISGSWAPDDTIFFNRGWNDGLWKISVDGGDPVKITTLGPGEFGHWSPSVLPGGDAVLFTVWNTSLDDIRIDVFSRKMDTWQTLVTGGAHPQYISTGHILYLQSGTLVAAPFDLKTLRIAEPRIPVLQDIKQSVTSGLGAYAVSGEGMLLYKRGGEWIARRRVVWCDRQGQVEPLSLPPAAYREIRLSPDGHALALSKFESGATNLWIHDFASQRTTQLTFESSNFRPVWSPDSRWLAFVSFRLGPFAVYQIPIDRSRSEEPLLTDPYDQTVTSWSPDGNSILFETNQPEAGAEIWYLSFDDREHPKPLVSTSAMEYGAVFHPTGKWIAYQSNESGRFEVFVRTFPEAGGVTQISTDGGWEPKWSRDGRQLFYISGDDRMMAVEIETDPRFRAGSPRELFRKKFTDYDVAPDGRFVMIEREKGGESSDLVVVFNWFEELKRKFSENE
ncbi:MAG: protein kinase [Gemmatimonadota bacterium]|nr:MAG: protein kinase [Gemmatimonadota bacterium]